MNRHFIITSPIQTGKSTAIQNWAVGRSDVGGFLSPIDHHSGLRILTRISTIETLDFELNKATDTSIHIGRFIFESQAFRESSLWLLDDLRRADFRYIVLDEVGKLELQGQGYDALVKDALEQCDSKKELIFVVRDSLLEEVIEKYDLQNATIITDLHIDL